MLVKPGFYEKFRCIASECPDTCCAGWEIDVDPDTYDLYRSLDGENGEFIRERLTVTENGATLCDEGKRCRFLRDDNLCELILRLGEESLCDICREHPRFYSDNGNLLLAGVGLCCPEAARLLLSEPFNIITEDDGYEITADERKSLDGMLSLIEYILNGDGTLGERLSRLMGDDDDTVDTYASLVSCYNTLEYMDSDTPNRFSSSAPCVRDARYRNLAAYFLYRYYFELSAQTAIKFTASSLIMIAAMGGELEVSAKDYSKEIEYDTDNVDVICEHLAYASGLSSLIKRVLPV